ncbi:flagellar basal body P-ring formation chaperone FlgA [Cupriavidus sp. SW-Y-13]|uniref:flagellar basal body P-ring formation chaperone FlgA n=1 Tax=Cupriavidus sp. SW-Y-13 TaxID=2653854 RepID=UPI0013658244|nr:flagellar basal body P-ring formation chaperone FlgA [Cupriavidus sp. SW-Y-13]MWL90532.1 flagellar basal body P-ring formation protein FlgA [Cupriavidus sp. SW-Y-13]
MRRVLRSLLPLLVLPCLGASMAVAAPGVHVVLPERAQVHRADVALGDVAQLRTQDLNTLRQLMSMSIGPAPRTGEAVVVDAKTLARFVQTHVKLPEHAVVWEGAPRVRIERAMQALSGEQIQAAARQRLESWLQARHARFAASAAQDIQALAVPAGSLELRPREIPDNQLATRRMVVWIDIWVAGDFVRTVSVAFDVNVYQDAWVARHDVRAGNALRTDDFERKQVDIARLGSAPVAVIPDGSRIRHNVLAGTPLLQAAVQAVPAVARGQMVTLRSQIGAIALEGRAEVLQDGWPGGRVQVRMPAGNAPVLARVAEDGTVELVQ